MGCIDRSNTAARLYQERRCVHRLLSCAHFLLIGVCDHLRHRLFLHSTAHSPDGKECLVKIQILYEENIRNGHKVYTTIDIPDGDYSVMLDIDYEQRLAEAKPEMRTWLLRLGFIGDEFKTARELLTKRLSGDGAFRNGRAA